MARFHYLTSQDITAKLKHLLSIGVKFSDDIRKPYFCIYNKSRILAIKMTSVWFVNMDNWGVTDKTILDRLNIKSISPGSYAIKLLEDHLLEQNINPKILWPKLKNEINRTIKSGYNSGTLYAKPGFYNQKVYHYDLNAAYGYAFKTVPIPYDAPNIIKGFVPKKEGYFNIYVMDLNVEYNSSEIFPYLVNSGDVYKRPSQVIDNTGFGSLYKVISEIEYYDLIKDYTVFEDTLYTIQFKTKTGIFDGFIDKLYDKRYEVDGEERMLWKTVLASLAGKHAQEIEETQVPTKLNEFGIVEYTIIKKAPGDVVYLNPAISLAVVDYVRKKIRDSIRKAGYKNVLVVDTDGFITTEPIDLPLGKELGLWKVKTYDNIIVNGTRSYFYTENNEFHSSISGLGDIYNDGINNFTYRNLYNLRKLKSSVPLVKKILFDGDYKYITMNVKLGGD